MEHYKINGKKITVPSGWHDVKFDTGLRIMKEQPSKAGIFALLIGESEEFVRSLTDPETISYFMEGFPFTRDFVFHPEVPLTAKFNNERLVFPDIDHDNPLDMGQMEVGQIEDMEAYIKKELPSAETLTDVDMVNIMPMLVAIYIQGIIDEEYDYKSAVKLESLVRKSMSFKDVVCMGYFFFEKLRDYISGFKNSYPRPRWMRRKLRQASRKLTRYLDSILR